MDSSYNSESKAYTEIQVTKKKKYNVFQKFFCCKCFTACQANEEDVQYSKKRKDKSKFLMSKWKIDKSKDSLLSDPLQLLIRLYIEDDTDAVQELLQRCRLNPSFISKKRTDLEFYIPQIVNWFVFHENMNNNQLKQFLRQAAYVDFFFGHLMYFYLKSVQKTIYKRYTEEYEQVGEILQEFADGLQNDYGNKLLIASEMISPLSQIRTQRLKSQSDWDDAQSKIKEYGTFEWEVERLEQGTKLEPSHIVLDNYKSMFDTPISNNDLSEKSQVIKNEGFLGVARFFEDLVKISEDLKFADPKVVSLRSEIKKLNQNLPAAIYIPFFQDSIRNYVVLNVVWNQCKVFSTKERAPYYICIELYRPEEQVEQETSLTQKIYNKMKQTDENPAKVWSYDIKLSEPLNALNENPITHVKRQYGSEDTVSQAIKPRGTLTKKESKKDNKKDNNNNNSTLHHSLISDERSQSQIEIQTIDIQQPSQYVPPKIEEPSNEFNTTIQQQDNKSESEQQQQHRSKENSQDPIKRSNETNQEFSKTFVDNRTSKTYENNLKVIRPVKKARSFSSELSNTLRQETSIGMACVYDAEQESVCQEEDLDDEQSIVEEEKLEQQSIQTARNKKNRSKETSFIAEQFVANHNRAKQLTINKTEVSYDKPQMSKQIFGEDVEEQEKKIREQSPYGHFKSWKLIHLIVKTGDNLKQEQFALQLIYQFQQIFELENTDLILRPYEILSVGPGEGLMEMVRNSVTFDGLKKTMHTKYKDIKDLDQFFTIFYGENHQKARDNFCKSVAAYSLVCYFLQVKDRHNGNILLHRDGYLVHIDFGFFLSIAPGKGLEFEGKVPFKMLQDYISILGGVKSDLFQQFRKMFFRGFMAARKHKDKILILTKMLYSGHGSTLPCFEKGDEAIRDLEARFNPKGVKTDQQIYSHCQELINQSIDNWRARWYDKYQYFCQGIFY